MNKCVISGRVVQDPELKTTNTGVAVTTNTLAVSRRQRDASGDYIVDFVDFTLWKQSAEFFCNYAKKGDMVTVAGEIRQDNYTDRNGINRVKHSIVSQEIELHSKKPAN
jgi:single-strand DNA-binding protein